MCRAGISTRRVLRLAGCLLAVGLLAACQGRTGFAPGGGLGGPPGGGRVVDLTDRDLAPVDAFLSARRAQWILGDDVEVVASREYFAQQLTVNRASGLVERVDSTTPSETTVSLRYLGEPGTESVTTNPRVLIGTGITITARRTLVVRLVRTRDETRPVRLLVRARGRAARGRKEQVTARAPELVLGGELRATAGGWTWVPVG